MNVPRATGNNQVIISFVNVIRSILHKQIGKIIDFYFNK